MFTDANQATETLRQAHEWGRAIVQSYMSWYVFFVAGNIAVLGWIHTRRVPNKAPKTMSTFRGMAAILAFQNLTGIVSSTFIIWYLMGLVGKDERLIAVIYVSGGANTLALVALLAIWVWVLWKRTYEVSFPSAKD